MSDTPNPLAEAMERATGEALTANQRAFLLSLSPQTGLDFFAAKEAAGAGGAFMFSGRVAEIVRAHLNAQAVALRDQAVQQARKEECDRLDKWWREEWRKLEQQHALDITNLNAQYAPLVAAWKEWRAAREAWNKCSPGPFPWSTEIKAIAARHDRAEEALSAVEDV